MAWRQCTGSIRAIAMYGWELGYTDTALERLRKLQYKAVRKVTGAYHGVAQVTIENIAKVEPVAVKLWDMKVRASARILEKGVQDNLIEEVERQFFLFFLFFFYINKTHSHLLGMRLWSEDLKA